MFRPLVIAAVLCLAGAAHAQEVHPADRAAASDGIGKRLALLVATSDYRDASWADLANPTRDAAALAAVLGRRYGYEVTSLVDPTVGELKAALRDLAERAGPSDDVLVFAAGHGHFDELDHAGYLVTKDANAGCASGCYPFDNLKRALFGTRARHVLFLLDVCYGGAFDLRVALGGQTVATRSATLGLRRVLRDYALHPSRLAFASVGRAITSDGPSGASSPFVAALLRELGSPDHRGVVDLDGLFVAMTRGSDPLPVQRPMVVESATPHHPNGTFLFIEKVDFCEAVDAIVGSQPEGFLPIAAEAERGRPYAESWSTSWLVPGTRGCRLWRWEGGTSPQVRCEIGRFDPGTAALRVAALRERLLACQALAGWEGEADTLVSGGRRVKLASLCDGDCNLELLFE
jgi:hypothetical protein